VETSTRSLSSEDRFILDEIREARAGDLEQLGRILESCRDYLSIMATRGLGHDLSAKGGASDLVQETLLGAYRDFGSFRGQSRDELLIWLQTILRNNLAVFRRRYRGTQKRRVAREVPIDTSDSQGPGNLVRDDSTAPGVRAERRERTVALLAALNRLSEDHRRVILWRQYDQLPFSEIGQRLGRSGEAARKLWSRALIQLSNLLGPVHDPQA